MATDTGQRERLRSSPRAVAAAVRSRLLDGDRPYVLGFVVSLVLALVVVSGPVRTWAAQRDLVETRREALAGLEDANGQLEARVEDLNDPATIEGQAREEMGMYSPGEVPYVVVPPAVDQPRLGPTTDTDDEPPSVVERLRQALSDVFG